VCFLLLQQQLVTHIIEPFVVGFIFQLLKPFLRWLAMLLRLDWCVICCENRCLRYVLCIFYMFLVVATAACNSHHRTVCRRFYISAIETFFRWLAMLFRLDWCVICCETPWLRYVLCIIGVFLVVATAACNSHHRTVCRRFSI
jgi:hypothetical protein